MTLEKIISGGQTGADQGALRAAKACGIATGGYVPKGWRTDEGAAPWLADYGLIEHCKSTYNPRTLSNVWESDATLWLGDHTSPGGKLTCGAASGQRGLLRIGRLSLRVPELAADIIVPWLASNPIRILNVAGNRESTQPGIGAEVEQLITLVIERLRAER